MGFEKYSEEWIQKTIADGRNFIKPPVYEECDYETDQDQKKTQPPLYKAAVSDQIISLPKNFQDLELSSDILEIFYKRKSSRVYTQQPLTLLELSYLLWATQGVKEIRGKSYATIRTVACGGARHEFEAYMVILNVEGVKPGCYHYLPETHSIECLYEKDFAEEEISTSLCEQIWGSKAAVVFYYSMVPYRAEWRYGIWAHRVALIDSGHITQNLYVACSSLKHVGTCAVASLDGEIANKMFRLDGEDEFIFYAAPVGCIQESDKTEEDAFYAFVKEQGL